MASPTLETFCCAFNGTKPVQDLLGNDSIVYNSVCLGTSFLGITGALVQLTSAGPRWAMAGFLSPSLEATSVGASRRQSRIVCWLACADLFAALGVLIRSSIWLWDALRQADDNSSSMLPFSFSRAVVCAWLSTWIHFFYTVTYLWTLLYAIDVYLTVRDRTPLRSSNHLIAWGGGAVLTVTGALLLYAPDLSCHHGEPYNYLFILPNYLASLIPMITTMVANPILYRLSFNRVEDHLAITRGEFTSEEHAAVDTLRVKFFAINFVFYLCWIPNVVNFVVLWLSWPQMPETLFFALWYLMAFLNPLQALFNCFVYGQWKRWFLHYWLPQEPKGERTPLLSSALQHRSISSGSDLGSTGLQWSSRKGFMK